MMNDILDNMAEQKRRICRLVQGDRSWIASLRSQ